jgi:alpha-tubulin suppressor-like RCC1 family protein
MRRVRQDPLGWWLTAVLAGAVSACGARSSLRTDLSGGFSADGAGAGQSTGGEGGSGAGMSTGEGAGGSACSDGVTCDDPPAPTCQSSTTLTVYAPIGSCATGECVYTHTDSACPAACSGGSCLPEPSSIHLTVGSQHSCVTAVSGGIKCWGHNESGQLGNGTTKESGVPIAVAGLSAGMRALAASGDTCAVTDAGALACWGHNESGQLGNGATSASLVPAGVAGLSSGVTAVAAGALHTCAVVAGGAVKCWGDNSSGELGNGTTADSLTPVAVKGLSSGGAAVALGFGHTCALLEGGSVKCWGLNTYGQLGTGAASDPVNAPVTVKGLSSGASALVTNSLHNCALVEGGTVKCWGHNVDGELGDGTVKDSAVPVPVKGLSAGVVALGAGTGHTCAVTAEGGVKCWGNNAFGQLGDNTTVVRHEPVDVVGLSSGVVAVALGFDHTCAVMTTGAVKCWGGNFYSQLGDGTKTQSLVPVDVIGL